MLWYCCMVLLYRYICYGIAVWYCCIGTYAMVLLYSGFAVAYGYT